KCILVNGQSVTQSDFPLKKGMHIDILKQQRDPLAGSPYVKVVYEDQWLVVIEKQSGIISMQNGFRGLCVKTLLDNYFLKMKRGCKAHVVHRLDRDTSGLMIFAKSTEVQQIFDKHWQELIYDRRYIAVVSGNMEEDKGIVDTWLKDNKAYHTYSSPTDNGGKRAITHYWTLDRKNNHSLVELKLLTGRKNQIRVHMETLGHPVIGDKKYGAIDDDPINRLGLHAFLLDFRHPITGQAMHFETPFPHAFLKLFSENKNEMKKREQ
ncbi:MAG: RluA family pseudouridine synthase, partial [Aeriscardovia sp.]|nr:RluA family pseudouridine synthase [Aeriscardovia sp.]